MGLLLQKNCYFLLLLHKENAEQPPRGESSPRRLAAQLRCETRGWSPVGHPALSGWVCGSAPTAGAASAAAKAELTSSCLCRRQRRVWVSVGGHPFVVQQEELVFKHVTGSSGKSGKSLPSCLHHNPGLAKDHTQKNSCFLRSFPGCILFTELKFWKNQQMCYCCGISIPVLSGVYFQWVPR